MPEYDFLIVGAGLTGAVLAERLTAKKHKVLVIEKRNHIGGNCFDYYDKDGVLVHKYGPHYFRTDDSRVFEYLSKFTSWRPFEYRIRSCVDGKYYPFPINRTTLNEFFHTNLKNPREVKKFLRTKRVDIKKPQNAEEYVLSHLGRELYEKFFKNYTIKQWNRDPKKLNASVTARIPIRYNDDDRYFNEKIQVMPKKGYNYLFNQLLKGIDVWLETDFYEIKNDIEYKYLIFTGPIDKYFNYKYGQLPYRSLKFMYENYDQEFYQDWVQINYPNDYDYTRIVEIKHATGQKCNNTTIVKEYPANEGEPYYPIPFKENSTIFQLYEQEASKLKNIFFKGRLATYRYLNMDSVVNEALGFSKNFS
ncbi:MAG: UDP-galactopyranose mutase [Candidatus Odinarchaeota archaeon]